MGFLPSWRRSVDDTREFIDAKTLTGARLPGPSWGVAEYPAQTFNNWARHGFKRNEVVYACVMEKATSAPESPLRVYSQDGQGPPLESHPLRQLLVEPNPEFTEFEFWETTIVHLDLAGNAFWEIVRDRTGFPRELWPIRPDLVRITPNRNPKIRKTYEVLVGSLWRSLGTDVLHFKYANPTDSHYGMAPLEAGLRASALDNDATDFVKLLLQNHAVPPVVIKPAEMVDQGKADALKARWKDAYSGANRGEPAVLQQGMEVETLGHTLRDLEFPDLRTISETRICMVFGVPGVLIGTKSGMDRSTYSNYGEARKSFWEETLMPLQTRLAQTVVRKLLPEVTGSRPRRVEVRFDHSNVIALRESEASRWERATESFRAGGITRNQYLRQIGEPEIGPAGEVYMTPAGVVPVPVDADPTTLAPFRPSTQNTPSSNGNEQRDEEKVDA